MWLLVEEEEPSRPELGIARNAREVQAGTWVSRASVWFKAPGGDNPDKPSAEGGAANGTALSSATSMPSSGGEHADGAGAAAAGATAGTLTSSGCARLFKGSKGETPSEPSPSLKDLVTKVLKAGLEYLTEAIDRDGNVRHGAKPFPTDSYDLNAVPFGFSSALSYIFPTSLVELWMEVAQKAVNRDNGNGEWSDREVVRHYLYLRAACTSFGGGIQFAIKGMLDRPATTRSRLNRLLIDVARCLSLETRNSIWIMVLVKAIEAVHDNLRFWAQDPDGEESEKQEQIELILQYVTHGNVQVRLKLGSPYLKLMAVGRYTMTTAD